MLTTTTMYHYVYLSFEEHPHGKNYIGVHSTEDLYDGYLGSCKDKSFTPDAKIILQFFQSRESAVLGEIQWQHVFKVVEDNTYANRAYQTATKFDTSGSTLWHNNEGKHTMSYEWPGTGWVKGPSPENRKKRSERFSGPNHPQYGKSQTSESNAKRAEALRGPKNHNYGKPREKEVCQKISQTKTGVKTYSKWWVNLLLELETHSRECPGEGWEPGRLKRKWWINAELQTKHCVKSPGDEWIEGRIWR
jgi:hypothetical protein